MKRLSLVTTAISISFAAAACGGSGGESASPTNERPAVEDSVPAEAAPTTGAAGVVWASAVDSNRVNTDTPQPSFAGTETGIDVQLELVVAIEVDSDTLFGQDCRAENEFRGVSDTDCLYVQFAYDVPTELGTAPSGKPYDTGTIKLVAAIGPDNKQINVGVGSENAFPGTVGNRLGVIVTGGQPESTLIVELQLWEGNSAWDPDTWTLPTPPTGEYAPVDF